MSIISRALIHAGQEPLTDEDIKNNTVKWRTIKELYLPLYLSVISSAEWTELKRRAVLTKDAGENLSTRLYAFTLPSDCSRAIELASGGCWETEGDTLYADEEEPVLLYITNGKTTAPGKGHDVKGSAFFEKSYYSLFSDGNTIRWENTGGDYPEYRDLKFSPEFIECFTMSLAAEFVVKITGDKQLYSMLVSLAEAARAKAEKQSRTKSASRVQAQSFWGERLGIPTRSF